MTPLLAHGSRTDRSFERMYKRHVGDVYRYALAVLRNPTDAEDVTQTTFLNAYRAYEGGERPRQPQNWLITIAHNVCRQRFRQSQRRPQEVAYDDNVGDWLEDEDRGPNAEDLRRALSHLAFNQRAALVMRELEGRSYAEIAEILGLTVAAVETLIFRARRALREQLEGALTCAEAELALSLEADGQLSRAEKGPLRAHLRECTECAGTARRQRAQRSAWKALGALPVPASLSSLFGGGGAAIGVKAAAVAASAIAAGGLGLAGERHFTPQHAKSKNRPGQPKQSAAPAAAPVKTSVTPIAVVVRRAAPAVQQHVAKHRSAQPERENGATKPEQQQDRGSGAQQPAEESQHSGGTGRGNATAVGHAKAKQHVNNGNGGGGRARTHRQASAEPAGSATASQPQGGQAKGRGNAARSSVDQGSSGGQNHGNGGGRNAAQSGLELPQATVPDLSGDLPKVPGN
jgi:RNA polymerase sigma factor (sigma-70 family)